MPVATPATVSVSQVDIGISGSAATAITGTISRAIHGSGHWWLARLTAEQPLLQRLVGGEISHQPA